MHHTFTQEEHQMNYSMDSPSDHVQKKLKENPLGVYNEYNPPPIITPTRKQRSDKGKKRGTNKTIQT
ncbi:hypothetical protein CLU79DRAFT_771126 [Phycomyces nitens]|nr:hypothetical protein CLU79DRAFT_771126 [Phycomyces nitens]